MHHAVLSVQQAAQLCLQLLRKRMQRVQNDAECINMMRELLLAGRGQ
jgi:hypothetical protein